MNKSILIINTPDNCYDCPLMYDNYSCIITGSLFFKGDFDPCKDILQNCPLKKIPEKYEIDKSKCSDSFYEFEFEAGYNQCIDEILENKE